MRMHTARLFLLLLLTSSIAAAQGWTWTKQPIAQPVPKLWGVSMFDTSRGLACGESYIYLPITISGMLRKDPGDPTWKLVDPFASFNPPLTSSIVFQYFSAVCAVPGTSRAFACGNSVGGINTLYRSDDYGQTWTLMVNGMTVTANLFEVYFKSADSGVTAGSGGTAYFTGNGGASWTKITTVTTETFYGVHTSAAGPHWYLTGSNKTIRKWMAPSSSWSISPSSIPGPANARIEGVHCVNSTTTFFGVGTDVVMSNDWGTTYTALPPITPSTSTLYTVWFFDPQTGWAAGSYGDLHYTSNGGSTWSSYAASPSGTSGNLTQFSFVDPTAGWATGPFGGTGQGWIIAMQPGVMPDISQSDTLADFGTMTCGTFVQTAITLSNSGTDTLRIQSGGITLPAGIIMVPPPSYPIVLPPGDSRSITLQWTPIPNQPDSIAAGTRISVVSNDADHTPWFIRLKGRRTISRMTAGVQTGTPVACVQSNTGTDIPYTVSGNADPMLIGWEFVSGDDNFTLQDPPPGTMLSGPGLLRIDFTPAARGNRKGFYRIISGNPACPDTQVVAVTGLGIGPALMVVTSPVSFGRTCPLFPVDREFLIINTSDGVATVDAITHVSGSGLFSIVTPPLPSRPLGVNDTLRVQVLFSPGAADVGIFTARFSITLRTDQPSPAGCSADFPVEFTAESAAPDIRIDPLPVDFGPVVTGTGRTRTVTVTNRGTTPVRIAQIKMGTTPASLTTTGAPTLPKMLGPNESFSFSLNYKPLKAETLAVVMEVSWDDPCRAAVQVPVTGEGTTPPRIVLPAALDFGVQLCPTPVVRTFVIRNAGDGPLEITSMKTVGAHPSHFRLIDPIPPLTIARGDSVIVTLHYDAPLNGTSSAELRIVHNDPGRGYESIVLLTGERQSPGITVEGDTLTTMTACPMKPVTRVFTVRNTGNAPVTLERLGTQGGGGEFGITGPALPTVLAVGDTISFTLTFTPPNPGGFVALIAIHASPCSMETLVRVLCIGDLGRPVITPIPVNFGSVQTGGTVQRPVTIVNPGSLPIRIERVSIQPASAPVVIDAPPSTPMDLTSGGSIPLTLTYAPTAGGPLNAWVCVDVSSPCRDSVCAELLGTASSNGIALDRGVLNLSLDPCTLDEGCDTVHIMNNGSSALSVTGLSITQTGTVFSLRSAPATPFTLAAGRSAVLTICATPRFTGTSNARLVVQSTDAQTPVIELPLIARRDSSDIRIAPTALDFGELTHCNPVKTMTVDVRNTGTTTETLTEYRVVPSSFDIVSGLPATLSPGATTQITVRFFTVPDGAGRDTLWMKSDLCGLRIPIDCRGSYYKQNAAIVPARIDFNGMNVGSSQATATTLSNLHATKVTVAAIEIVPAGVFTSETSLPVTVDSGQAVPLTFRFTPVVKGPASATARVILSSPCPDTLIVLLAGTATDNGLVFRNGGLNFGDRAQCEAPVLEDTLINTGSSEFTLTGSTLTGTGAPFYTILNPVTANETLAGGAMRVFQVQFAPGMGADKPEPAVLRVSMTDTTQATVDLSIAGARSVQVTPADVVEYTGTIPVGQQHRVSAMLTNRSYRPVTYTSASAPPEVLVGTTLPKTFWIGNETIVSYVTPQKAGPFSFFVTLYIDTPCKDSTKIIITGVAESGTWSQTAASFDAMPACGTQRKTVTLKNGDGFSKRIYGISIGGTDSTYFSVISPATPLDVAAGDSAIITVAFTPANSTRSYSATCVTFLSDTANARRVESMLTASSERALLTADALPLDAGSGVTGTVVTRTVQVRNTTSRAVTIGDARLSAMTVRATQPALPAVVPPNGSLVITIEWTPVVAGAVSDSLTLVETAPCDDRMVFAVTGLGQPLNVVTTALSIPVLEGAIDERILIPVHSATDLGTTGTHSWSGSIRFNRTMLYPLRVVKEGTLSADMPDVIMSYDHGSGTVTLAGSGAALRSGSGPLARVEALVLLGDALETPVDIDPAFDFTSGSARVAVRTPGAFHLVGYCMGAGNRLVRINGSFQLQQNHPNPFNPSTDIRYSIAEDGPVRLTVHDAWGRDVATLVDAPQTAGPHMVRFDAAELPSGVYFYRLVSGRFMETRRMVLGK